MMTQIVEIVTFRLGPELTDGQAIQIAEGIASFPAARPGFQARMLRREVEEILGTDQMPRVDRDSVSPHQTG